MDLRLLLKLTINEIRIIEQDISFHFRVGGDIGGKICVNEDYSLNYNQPVELCSCQTVINYYTET